jgi:hypothetical protein
MGPRGIRKSRVRRFVGHAAGITIPGSEAISLFYSSAQAELRKLSLVKFQKGAAI